jgi:E3 ubiquitin-protein ligase RNF115/126
MEQTTSHNGAPPASVDRINALPRVTLKLADLGEDHQECAICQDAYKDGEEGLKLPCQHIFHPACVRRWLESHGMILFVS